MERKNLEEYERKRRLRLNNIEAGIYLNKYELQDFKQKLQRDMSRIQKVENDLKELQQREEQRNQDRESRYEAYKVFMRMLDTYFGK